MIDEQHARKHAEQMEQIINDVETITDPSLREKVATLVQSLLSFHANAIQRFMQLVATERGGADPLLEKIASDPLTGSLLLLYGVHPASLEIRVKQAIDRLGSSSQLNGAVIELVELADNVVRLRLTQTTRACHSSPQLLRTAIEEALYEAAPDLDEVQFVADVQHASIGFVPLESVRGKDGFTRTISATLSKTS